MFSSFGKSALQTKNLWTMSCGSSSSHCCPVTRQMSFKSSRISTVNGATRPMGSKTFETRLRTKRCVRDLLIAQIEPLLTTKISLVWSHFSRSTCDESSWHDTITLGSVVWGETSIRSARFVTLLTNFVSLNPPRWRRCTNSFDLLMALSRDSTESR